jgi:hypothetical protein
LSGDVARKKKRKKKVEEMAAIASEYIVWREEEKVLRVLRRI